jgi:homoserine kinase
MLEGAPEHGALGAALSGAGPTTLFFYQDDLCKERLLSFIERVMSGYGIRYRVMTLLPDEQGTTIDESVLSGA